MRYHLAIMAGSKKARGRGKGRRRSPAEPPGGRPDRTVYRSEERGKGRPQGEAGGGRRRRAGAYASMSAEERRRLQRRVWILRLVAVLVFSVGVLLLVYFTVGRGATGTSSPSPSPTAASSTSPSASPSGSPTAASPTPSASPSVAVLPPSARSQPVPILMYHVLAAPPGRARYPTLFVSIAAFTQEVRWLHSHGYHSVTLTQLFDFWSGKGDLPVKPVVLSFDDGYSNDWTVGGRVLSRYGFAGVLNLVVDNIMPKGGITTQQVNSLLDRGWELAAHTIHHWDLTTLDAAQLTQEVAGSRRALQRRFHVPVYFFCYPSGAFNDTVVAAVKAAGFRGATTTIEGPATRGDAYRLPRIRVDGGETLKRFVDLLLQR